MIDEEISKLVESAYNEALRILTENKEGLIQLAEKLLDKEVIFSEDVENIFGKRPWAVEERNFTKTDEDSETKKDETETNEANSKENHAGKSDNEEKTEMNKVNNEENHAEESGDDTK